MHPGSHAGVLRNHDGLQWLRENSELQRVVEGSFFGSAELGGLGLGVGARLSLFKCLVSLSSRLLTGVDRVCARAWVINTCWKPRYYFLSRKLQPLVTGKV